MGNHRFKLSEMIPNAWFYKLKDMNRASSTKRSTHHHHHPLNPLPPPSSSHHQSHQKHQQKQPSPPLIPSRASYYFPSDSPLHPKALDTHFPPLDSPRKSTRRSRRKPISPRPMISSSLTMTTSTTESESAAHDIIIDMAGAQLELELRPIITKAPTKRKEAKKQQQQQHHHHEEQQITKKPAATPQAIQWLRMQANSRRLVTKKVRVVQRSGSRQRKSLSESFAVVKSSSDPKRDFRESMMEMITENNLRASKDLEELLACYLSLNSNEYHDVIVKVFEEIWFDLSGRKY